MKVTLLILILFLVVAVPVEAKGGGGGGHASSGHSSFSSHTSVSTPHSTTTSHTNSAPKPAVKIAPKTQPKAVAENKTNTNKDTAKPVDNQKSAPQQTVRHVTEVHHVSYWNPFSSDWFIWYWFFGRSHDTPTTVINNNVASSSARPTNTR